MSLTTPLSAFRARDFRIFWMGFVVSNIGSWMGTFALGWMTVQLAVRDGAPELGPFYLGLMGLSRAVPGLSFGMFGGVIADRFDRRTLLMVTTAGFAAVAVALGALALADRMTIAAALLLSTAFSLTGCLYVPARQAILARAAGTENLMSAIGLNSLALSIGALAGPLLGGVLIGPLGIGGVMIACAAAYLTTLASLTLMSAYPADHGARDTHVLRSLREGVEYVVHNRLLLWLMIVFGATSILVRPYLELLPAVARDSLHVGAVELSWLVAGAGLGQMLGGFTTASLGGTRQRGRIVVGTAIGAGVGVMLLGLQRDLLPALLLMPVLHALLMVSAGMVATVFQLETPDRLRGRIVGVQSMVIEGGMPLGLLALGTLGTLLSASTALAVGGAILVTVCLAIYATVPRLRDATAPVAR